MDYVVVTTTTETMDEATRIATALVERRLAACVQILGPIRSVYRWQGEVTSAEEYRLEMKTRNDQFPAIRDLVKELHSYQLPELIATPLADMSVEYRHWLDEQLQGDA